MKYDAIKRYAEKKDLKRRAEYESGSLIGNRLESEQCGERVVTLLYKGEKDGLIITVHGGGFLYNSVYDEDNYCDFLRRITGFNIASLDYTLSYKRTYPTQLNQCDGQIKELLRSDFGGGKIALVGHSAGANLAAAITLKSIREKQYKISALCLNYPGLDNYKLGKERKFYPFTFMNSTLDTFSEIYCENRENRRDPLVSPLFATDEELALFPPTVLVKSKGDKLGEDAERMYERLSSVGVETELVNAKMRHGFIEDGMRRKGGAMRKYAEEVTKRTMKSLCDMLSKDVTK